MDEHRPIPAFRLNPEIEKAQIERLRAVRAARDQTAVKANLIALDSTARDGGNLMPKILDAAGQYATVGEISDALRRVFGEYREAA